MNFTKQLLSVFSILSALCTAYSGPASAQSIDNLAATAETPTLILSRPDKRPPTVSLINGPLGADEKVLIVKVDMPLIGALVARYASKIEIEQHREFYREIRGFSNPRAIFAIRHYDGSTTSRSLDIAKGAPGAATLNLSKRINYQETIVTGLSYVYKCLAADKCVFEKTAPRTIWTVDEVIVKQ